MFLDFIVILITSSPFFSYWCPLVESTYSLACLLDNSSLERVFGGSPRNAPLLTCNLCEKLKFHQLLSFIPI